MSRASRPKVKICGLTRSQDAALAVALGTDYLGLNFWPGSTRFLAPERALEVAAPARGRAAVVGVFVDATAAEIESIAARVRLDAVQLHGDEDPSILRELDRPVIRALRRVRPEAGELAAWEGVEAFLFDCPAPGRYGGTGESWDWSALAGLESPAPFFLAGGLKPTNVAEAVATVRPWGIDLCSGVEAEPGVKDRDRMQRLFAALEPRPGPERAEREILSGAVSSGAGQQGGPGGTGRGAQRTGEE